MTHALPEPYWPSQQEAERSLLFSPISVGSFTAPTRSWIPAMVPWRATEEGEVTQDVVDWYGRFAEGQPGVLVIEATGIRDVASGPLLRIGHDRFIPGLKRIVDEVRKRSNGQTRLLIQLIDFLSIRRRPEPEKYFERFLQIQNRHREGLQCITGEASWITAEESEIRAALLPLSPEELELVLDARELEALRYGARQRVWDLHDPNIAELPRVLPKLFASAAQRAQAAGFDGVELHYAHAYTMASFLSPLNQRTDGYGSNLQGRLRLPLEVYAAVRKAVGNDYTLGCRYLGDEVIEGGGRLQDAMEFAKAFASAGMDFLSISKGGKFEDAKQPRMGQAAYPYTGASGLECMPTIRMEATPFSRNMPIARAIRQAVRDAGFYTPVIGAGGIASFGQAEQALQDEDCDLIASARQSLADPDWWLKMRRGKGSSVRRCKFTNYCEGLDQKHKQVTCQLWDKDKETPDRLGASPALSSDGKRRMVPPPPLDL
ncbi:MAG: 2,4-dienoyl-CoA reductase-like NADH-dependent reductase (Old Yellow Enzyme family) [Glaciecola sp.]|jgi:2,4-dienoyl-CoA reductase-like NADH-dependent reductase (Old Yellow Enzyme family)